MCRVDYGVRVRGFTPSRAPVVFVTMFARAGIAHAPWRMGSPPEDIGIPVAELRVAANGEGPSRREEHVELEGPGRCRFANTLPQTRRVGTTNSQLHRSGGTSRPTVASFMTDEAINAKAAFAAGDYETAAALFTQLLEEGTADDHLQLCNRSAALLNLGDAAAAEADARRALRLCPGFVKAHFRLATALFEGGHREDAHCACVEALQQGQSSRRSPMSPPTTPQDHCATTTSSMLWASG